MCIVTPFAAKCVGAVQVDINTEVSVVHDVRLQELRLYTDYGRCSRPLFIVENQALKITKAHIQAVMDRDVSKFTWSELIKRGFVEYATASAADVGGVCAWQAVWVLTVQLGAVQDGCSCTWPASQSALHSVCMLRRFTHHQWESRCQ